MCIDACVSKIKIRLKDTLERCEVSPGMVLWVDLKFRHAEVMTPAVGFFEGGRGHGSEVLEVGPDTASYVLHIVSSSILML